MVLIAGDSARYSFAAVTLHYIHFHSFLTFWGV